MMNVSVSLGCSGEQNMKSDTQLDYAVFQLTQDTTRCELYVVAHDVTFKLASGLLASFKMHVPLIEQHLQSGSNFIRLEPPDPVKSPWFTKGTMERFIRFVSMPELLERVNVIEVERSQLEDTLHSPQLSNSVESSVQRQVESESLAFHTSGGNASIAMNVEKPVEEGSKQWLLKALDIRRLELEEEQETAFEQANAAGFNAGTICDLLMFAECFGAARLWGACSRFMALCCKRQKAQDYRAVALGKSKQADLIATGVVIGDSSRKIGQDAIFSRERRMDRMEHLASRGSSLQGQSGGMLQEYIMVSGLSDFDGQMHLIHNPQQGFLSSGPEVPPSPHPPPRSIMSSSSPPPPPSLPPPPPPPPPPPVRLQGLFSSPRCTGGNTDRKALDTLGMPLSSRPPRSPYIPAGQQAAIVQQVIDQIREGKVLRTYRPQQESSEEQACGHQCPDKVLASRMEVSDEQYLPPMRRVQADVQDINYRAVIQNVLSESSCHCKEGAIDKESLKAKAETGQISVQDFIGLFENRKYETGDVKQKIFKNRTSCNTAALRKWTDPDVIGRLENPGDREDEMQTNDGDFLVRGSSVSLCQDIVKQEIIGSSESLCQDTAKQEMNISDYERQVANVSLLGKKACGIKQKEQSGTHMQLNSFGMSGEQELTVVGDDETATNFKKSILLDLEETGTNGLSPSCKTKCDPSDAGASGQTGNDSGMNHELQAFDMVGSYSNNHVKPMKLPKLKPVIGNVPKAKATHDSLERGKSVAGKQAERPKPFTEAQMRAEKLRAYKADLRKNKEEKDEEERKRIEDLKAQRRERITGPHGSVAPITQSFNSSRIARPSPLVVSNKSPSSVPQTNHRLVSSDKTYTSSLRVGWSTQPSLTLDSSRNAVSRSVPSLNELKREDIKDMARRTSLTRHNFKVTDAHPCNGHFEEKKKPRLQKAMGDGTIKDYAEESKKPTCTVGRKGMLSSQENHIQRSQFSRASKGTLVAKKQSKQVVRLPPSKMATDLTTQQNLLKAVTSNANSPSVMNVLENIPGPSSQALHHGEAEHLAEASGTSDAVCVAEELTMHEHGHVQVRAPSSMEIKTIQSVTDDSFVCEALKVDSIEDLNKEQNQKVGKAGPFFHSVSGESYVDILTGVHVDATSESYFTPCYVMSNDSFNMAHAQANVDIVNKGEPVSEYTGHYSPPMAPLLQLSPIPFQNSSRGTSGEDENLAFGCGAEHYNLPMAPMSQPSPLAHQSTLGPNPGSPILDQYNTSPALPVASLAETPPGTTHLHHKSIQKTQSSEVSATNTQRNTMSHKKWSQAEPHKAQKNQAKRIKRLLLRKMNSQKLLHSLSSDWISSINSVGVDEIDDVRDSASTKTRSSSISPTEKFVDPASHPFFSLSTLRGKSGAKA